MAEDGPAVEAPAEEGPAEEDGPEEDGPEEDGPAEEGPAEEGPADAGGNVETNAGGAGRATLWVGACGAVGCKTRRTACSMYGARRSGFAARYSGRAAATCSRTMVCVAASWSRSALTCALRSAWV